ncbi:hypothetical protein AB0I28_35355 [Phytomonospora sp. NPDC050363]|uniref:hypothetical protein n=1 Tax=Phytomonospora sp. NPDC050363 TaxID=3155642 RepID=UPI0033D056E4
METLGKKTQNRRTVLVMAVLTLLGYVVYVAAYQPTPFDRFQAADPRGASACRGLQHWLDEGGTPVWVPRMNAIGYNASLARTPAISRTSGLIEDDERFAAFRDGAVQDEYRFYGYGRGRDYADDLASLDLACAAQGIDMPAYHALV